MSMSDKEQVATTITQLVKSSNATDSEDGDVSSIDTENNNELDNSTNVKGFSDSADIESQGTHQRKVKLLDRLRAANMLVSGSQLDREIQDDYRRIKRPLVSNACGRDRQMVDRGNLILVTSSIPGEGKTFTSINLALSISQEMDNTVLLVDCDVAKQGVSRMLGLENVAGLVDVLESDDLTIGDVLLQTDIPNFRVVSAGKQNEYITEMLASQRMSVLVNEIASRYTDRIIIFDGPPMLPTPQTKVLAGLVGQVVFVVEAGKTPQALVEEALEMISKEQAVGVVLNKNEGLSRRGSYYYGYYGSEDGAV